MHKSRRLPTLPRHARRLVPTLASDRVDTALLIFAPIVVLGALPMKVFMVLSLRGTRGGLRAANQAATEELSVTVQQNAGHARSAETMAQRRTRW